MKKCLEPERIAQYLDGVLSDKERIAVERHLAECDECLELFVMSKAMIVDLNSIVKAPAGIVSEVLARIKSQIGRFFEWVDNLPPPEWIMQYSVSPVRSISSVSVGAVALEKKFADLATQLYIQQAEPEKVCIWIKVEKGDKTAKNVSLTLKKEGGRPLARFLTRDYEFFEKLRYGSYALVLEQDAEEKGTYLFTIDKEGFHEK